jgi:hypothetical protein
MKPKIKKVKVYLDGIDWLYEVGHASDGNTVYPGVNSLKEYNRCWDGCGIVECELVFNKWLHEHDWKRMAGESVTYTAEDLENNADIMQLESAQKRLQWLEGKVSKEKHRIVELKVNLKKKGKK